MKYLATKVTGFREHSDAIVSDFSNDQIVVSPDPGDFEGPEAVQLHQSVVGDEEPVIVVYLDNE